MRPKKAGPVLNLPLIFQVKKFHILVFFASPRPPGQAASAQKQHLCGGYLEVPAQAGVDLVDGAVAPPHFGVVVDPGRQVLADKHGDVAPHHGIIPLRLVGG